MCTSILLLAITRSWAVPLKRLKLNSAAPSGWGTAWRLTAIDLLSHLSMFPYQSRVLKDQNIQILQYASTNALPSFLSIMWGLNTRRCTTCGWTKKRGWRLNSEEETALYVHAQFNLRLHGPGRPTCCFVLTQMCMAAHEYRRLLHSTQLNTFTVHRFPDFNSKPSVKALHVSPAFIIQQSFCLSH